MKHFKRGVTLDRGGGDGPRLMSQSVGLIGIAILFHHTPAGERHYLLLFAIRVLPKFLINSMIQPILGTYYV